MKFDTLSTYGIMNEYSKNTIKDLIYFLITECYIEPVGNQYPVLKLTPNASNVLFNDEKVTIKRKIEKITEKVETEYDTKLFDILRNLRKDISIETNVPPFIVSSDTTLKEMATYYPTTEEKMLGISGVGSLKLEKYGDAFLGVIRNYVAENNIPVESVNLEPKKIRKVQSSDAPKLDTATVSYNLFKEGKSITEIAEERELNVRTIEGHLLKCYELGMEIDLSSYVQDKFEEDIYRAIESLGYKKLRALKDALPEEVSYFDINYYLVKYRRKDLA